MDTLLARSFAYNAAANEVTLAAVTAPGTPARALRTLQHALATEVTWLHRVFPPDVPAPLWQDGDAATCRAWLAEASAGWERLFRVTDVSGDFEYRDLRGNPHTTRWHDVLQHVLVHSAQYRGEALGLVAAAGLPVPDIDYLFYVRGDARFGKSG